MLRLPSNLTWRFLGYTVTIEHHILGTFGGLWKRVKYVAVYFREQRELWQAIRLVSVRCNVWNNCSCPFILQTLFYKGLKAISLGSRDLYSYFTIWTCPISSVSEIIPFRLNFLFSGARAFALRHQRKFTLDTSTVLNTYANLYQRKYVDNIFIVFIHQLTKDKPWNNKHSIKYVVPFWTTN